MNLYKSMGPDYMHPRVPKELAAVVAKPLCILSEKLWLSDKVPGDWRKGNINPVFKNMKKNGSGNYRLMILTSVPEKMME